ncbi:MAG: CRISPR-associated endonuclease Cas1, partial [Anaerolineales bacterium]|nr:CRISPR-associated endonuclease Cas1 [Anaerolineales bacterium]
YVSVEVKWSIFPEVCRYGMTVIDNFREGFGGFGMTSVYVKEQGAMVRRRGERLVVSKDGAIIDEFPFAKVEQLTLMGNVQLTTQAAATLLAREIDVVFLSTYGKFRGRLTGAGSKHAELRQQQLKLMSENNFSLQMARAIVDGKIHNQRVILQRQAARLSSGRPQSRGATVWPRDKGLFQQSLAGMMRMQEQARQAGSVESLRGYEGKAAAFYFKAVRSLLDPAWGFERRDYYPPPDPFNALLSFSYSLLLKDVQAAVQIIGLDLYVGFFHEIHYGRPSLALDLMEEWRPVIADALCLELINRGSLTPDRFVRTGRANRPIELGEAGVELVLETYGARLGARVYHPLAGPGGETSLRQAITLQARRLARVIAGKEQRYEAVLAK